MYDILNGFPQGRPIARSEATEFLFRPDDPSLRELALWAISPHESTLEDVRLAILAYIKALRIQVQDLEAATEHIEALYDHAVRQQCEIVRLEERVATLEAQVANLWRDRHAQVALEAVEALKAGRDVDTVLERVRRDYMRAEEPKEEEHGAES